MKQKRQIINKTFVLTAVIGSLLIMTMLTVKYAVEFKKDRSGNG